MNPTLLFSSLLATVALTACDKPTVVNVPAPAAAPAAAPAPPPGPPVPGPPGPPGATGEQGKTSDTVIIVTPPASAPTN